RHRAGAAPASGVRAHPPVLGAGVAGGGDAGAQPRSRGRLLRRLMSHQYVFTMVRITRVHPPDRKVLYAVTLTVRPGAKIGVRGPNGAGKSALLRIMGGVDQDYRGEASLA